MGTVSINRASGVAANIFMPALDVISVMRGVDPTNIERVQANIYNPAYQQVDLGYKDPILDTINAVNEAEYTPTGISVDNSMTSTLPKFTFKNLASLCFMTIGGFLPPAGFLESKTSTLEAFGYQTATAIRTIMSMYIAKQGRIFENWFTQVSLDKVSDEVLRDSWRYSYVQFMKQQISFEFAHVGASNSSAEWLFTPTLLSGFDMGLQLFSRKVIGLNRENIEKEHIRAIAPDAFEDDILKKLFKNPLEKELIFNGGFRSKVNKFYKNGVLSETSKDELIKLYSSSKTSKAEVAAILFGDIASTATFVLFGANIDAYFPYLITRKLFAETFNLIFQTKNMIRYEKQKRKEEISKYILESRNDTDFPYAETAINLAYVINNKPWGREVFLNMLSNKSFLTSKIDLINNLHRSMLNETEIDSRIEEIFPRSDYNDYNTMMKERFVKNREVYMQWLKGADRIAFENLMKNNP